MTTISNTNTSKKIAHVFVDSLAWIGLAIGLVVLAAAACPQFERQVEDYVGYYVLGSN